MEKPSVPKFGSYRPKKGVSLDAEIGSKIQKRISQSRSGPHLSDNTGHDETRHSDLSVKNSSKYRERHSKQTQGTNLGNLKRATEPEASVISQYNQSEIFFEDRRGDPGNIQYGSTNQYDIPSYRQSRDMHVLGDAEVSKRAHEPPTSMLSNLGTEQLRTLKEIPKLISQEDMNWEHDQDFMSLNAPKRRKLTSTIDKRAILGLANIGERHIERTISMSPPLSLSSEQSNSTSKEDATDRIDTYDMKLHRRNEELSSMAKQGGSLAWLEYINFQDIWLRNGHSLDSYRAPQDENRSIASVKLSMYAKAIRDCPKSGDENRERLLIGMMEEAEKSLDMIKLAAKWRELIDTEGFNDHFDIRFKYVNFIQTAFEEFSYERCRSSFTQYLDFLDRHSARYDKPRNSAAAARSSRQRIHVLLRLTFLFRDAAYTELSVALWQALLELNFRYSKSDWDKSKSFVLHKLENFWESEAPRIGEGESSSSHNANGSKPPEVMAQEGEQVQYEDRTSLTQWAAEERIYSLQSVRPSRTTDEEVIEDPYRVVLFSDVEGFLFRADEALKPELIDSFLIFFGLPSLSNAPANSLTWRRDSLLVSDLPLELEDPKAKSYKILSHLEQFQTSTETLFCNTGQLFRSFKFNGANNPDMRSIQDAPLVRNTLYHLVLTMPDYDELAEYYLAFELHLDPVGARKRAKVLLKSRSSNLVLYNAYALIESRSGNVAVANRVFSTAIDMSSSLEAHKRKDAVILWRFWIWEALRNNERHTALAHIVRMGKDLDVAETSHSYPSSEELEDARARIIEGHATSATMNCHRHAIIYIELLALFTYLTTSQGLSAALDTYSSFSHLYEGFTTSKGPSDPHLELLHQSQAQLITYHTRLLDDASTIISNPYPPAAVRAALGRSIHLFPNNTIFLTLYAANEARFRIDDAVRDIMRNTVLHGEPDSADAPTASTWAFAIRSEMTRAFNMSSTSHAVRATFERAVKSREGRNCAVLWATYVIFELEMLEADEEPGQGGEHKHGGKRAREVFFRGLRCLPWVKAYAMIAFNRLGGVLTAVDLRRVYDLMVEKGMRIHVDYDDWLEQPQGS